MVSRSLVVAGTVIAIAVTGTTTVDADDNSCRLAYNGICDEPAIGSGYCPADTDTADCSARPIWIRDPRNPLDFFGRDDRVFADITRQPWRSIGKLHMRSGNICTGALVGDRVVLTAAHCMYVDGELDRRDQVDGFSVGEAGQGAMTMAGVEFSVVAPAFAQLHASESREAHAHDYAFAILDRPLGRIFGSLMVVPLSQAELDHAHVLAVPLFIQAGYTGDAEAHMTTHLGCRVLDTPIPGTIFTDCDVGPGDSGSPVIVKRDGSFAIVGVMSAMLFDSPGIHVANVAVDARSFSAAYDDVLATYP